MRRWFQHRPVLSWALYDWANSAFATTVMAGFFPVYFRQFWSVGSDPVATTARLGYANAVAGLVVALLAPLLGALADRSARRKQWLLAWTALGVLGTAGLYFAGRGQWLAAAVLYGLATMGFSGGIVFSDALLPLVARERDYDRVSAFGYALGYLGGGLLFLLNVLMVLQPGWFGLASPSEAVRYAFVSVAVWWALFTLPLLLGVRERHERAGSAGGAVPAAAAGIAAGWRELWQTLQVVRQQRALWLFLIAYWLYIDGVNTVIKMAVDFGMAIGLPAAGLMQALLLTQFVAFPAALAFGWLGGRIGARRAILLGIGVYCAVTLWSMAMDSVAGFYGMAVVVGLVQGGVQSLSRSLFARFVPEGKSAEYFGFYNMVGKFATILGPALIALTATLTGDARRAIASVALLFVAGGLLLWRVQDQRAGSSA
ncbi:MAG: MFS transporter [Gammaproteobacteria bacterium]|nr:MFS transporter [Gammaproteobacteria bacterium]